MKELFAIAFTCVYLLLTVGVIKNTHYCMGRINASLPISEADSVASNWPLSLQKENAKFYIMENLYSQAFVIYVA